MSLPLSILEWWQTGTAQPSIPVNDNALRTMISMKAAVSDSVTAQPALTSPADDGTWYIIPVGATGAQWSTFAADSCAIFYGGNWYEFTPQDGDIVGIETSLYVYSGSAGWSSIGGGGLPEWGSITGTLNDQTDLVEALDEVAIVTEAGASTMDPATHSGRRKYVRCGGDVTFDSAETYSTGQVYNIRATGTLELLEDGVTLTPPYGGTLEMLAGMSVSVVMTSPTAGDVIGQTVPTP